jgi:ribosomal protein S18 acetylase RimI-like enzyme
MHPVKHVVDLQTVLPVELEELLKRESQLWRERLFWDVADRVAMLRRVLERRGVQGVALRIGTRTVGYAYYVIVGRLGVLAGLDIAPHGDAAEAVHTLVQAAVQALRQHDITRIESPFISFDSRWLSPAFEAEGFRTYWREFLRINNLNTPSKPLNALPPMHLEPWHNTHLSEAAEIMHAAYDGETDTEMSLLYRTERGCRWILDHILHQRNSGVTIDQASAFIRDRGQGVGFIVITEIARRQGHLAQVAVLPAYQGRGVGQWLVNHSLSQLAALQFDTLSLIVSRDNTRAFRLYQNMGFQSVLAFPVFVWEPPA